MLNTAPTLTLTQHHPRRFRDRHYVYPVVSRRSGGLSLGINLSPTAQCNFTCVYCQVLGERDVRFPNCEGLQENNRIEDGMSPLIDLPRLESELRELIGMVENGELFQEDRFAQTPPDKRGLQDIAFSGDGEPTLNSRFPEVVQRVAIVRAECCPPSTKIVLITNGTRLNVPKVREACRMLLANNGEIWAKLDAGTEEYFRTISRSTLSFEKILSNLAQAAKKIPLVIQSCFLLLHGEEPAMVEIQAYADRLRKIIDGGGTIQRVQIYTTARRTPEPWVLPLPDDRINEIATFVRRQTGLTVETFYSR